MTARLKICLFVVFVSLLLPARSFAMALAPAIPVAKILFVGLITCVRVSPPGPRTPLCPPAPSCKIGPSYYTFEDLQNEFYSRPNDFSFDNSRPPSQAVALLPSRPPDAGIIYPAEVKADGSIKYLSFPWDRLFLVKGDIIFMRGGDSTGKFVGSFSAFTHTAMVWSKPFKEAFESAKDDKSNGVDRRTAGTAWGDKIVTFAIKRVSTLSSSRIGEALDYAWDSYRGKPYFPTNIPTTSIDRSLYLTRWMDKNDLSSMYCSKLVWWTFKNKGVDLDSNRTKSSTYSEPGSNNWLGVSPDDIYYSTRLARDLYCDGKENLNKRFDSVL